MVTKFALTLTFVSDEGHTKTFKISQVGKIAPSVLFEEVLPFKQGTQRISSYSPKIDPSIYVAEDMAEWISVELGARNGTKEAWTKAYGEILSQVEKAVEFIWAL